MPTTTVRYYERIGLVKPTARSGSNYRTYGLDSLERLRFVRTAQSAGLSLDDVAILLRLSDDGEGMTRDARQELRLVRENSTGTIATARRASPFSR